MLLTCYAVTSRHYSWAYSDFNLGLGHERVAEGNEVRGPKGQERGSLGFLGRRQQPTPHQLVGLGERCKLPQQGAAKRFYHV